MVPWEQFINLVGFMVGDPVEGVGKPCLRVDAVQFGGLNQGIDDGGGLVLMQEPSTPSAECVFMRFAAKVGSSQTSRSCNTQQSSPHSKADIGKSASNGRKVPQSRHPQN